MKDDCTDCEFFDVENGRCIKGHELLLSYVIPDDCQDFIGGW